MQYFNNRDVTHIRPMQNITDHLLIHGHILSTINGLFIYLFVVMKKETSPKQATRMEQKIISNNVSTSKCEHLRQCIVL